MKKLILFLLLLCLMAVTALSEGTQEITVDDYTVLDGTVQLSVSCQCDQPV